MPIREPIERICSQTSQFLGKPEKKKQMWAQQSLLIKNSDDIYKSNDSQCWSQPLIINGVRYKHITETNEFRNIYVELLEAENPYNIYTLKDIDNRIHDTTFQGDKLEELLYDKKLCSISSKKYISSSKLLEKLRLIPFKVNVHKSKILSESQFIFATTRTKYVIDNSWVRTKMGSNMYTSWLGFNYSIYRQNNTPAPITFGNHVSRLDIKYEHFINSMNILLQIDYVIPMETKIGLLLNKENKISHFTFHDIKYHFRKIFNVYNKKLTDWKVIHSSSTSNAMSSSKICGSITKQDKDILFKYNQYDIALFDVSKLIKIADETFHNL